MPGIRPTLDTVMRRGLQANPQSAVRISQVRRISRVLSKGSPMPMNTMLVRRSTSGIPHIWFMISAAVRLPLQPCLPVMQNWQFILQPTWQDTQRVPRSSSGIKTVSI